MAQRQRSARRRSSRYGGGRRGWPLVKYGMIVFAVGVVITIATYAFAVSRGGGTYLVSYGPMVVGLISMARGGIDMARERRAGGPAAGGSFGEAQAAGQPSFGGPDFGGQQAGGWQGGSPQASFQPAGQASFQPAGAPMSAQTMPGAGAQGGGWVPTADGGDRAGRGGSDYAGYGADSTANAGYSAANAGYGAASMADTANAARSAPNAAPPAANWYPDPQNPAMLRWWDGQSWTSHTRPYN